MFTTTHHLDGYQVVHYHGIVTGHAILGVNFFRDWLAAIRDVIGGRSNSYENMLRQAELHALEEMNAMAVGSGANAVIGVNIDHETISKRGSMIMVTAYGTAVTVRRPDSDPGR